MLKISEMLHFVILRQFLSAKSFYKWVRDYLENGGFKMGIGNVALKVVRGVFANPLRKGAKSYERIPMCAGLILSGMEGARAIHNYNKGNDAQGNKSLINGSVGLAISAGSVLGPVGALAFGYGMYHISKDAQNGFAEDKHQKAKGIGIVA